MNEPFAELGSDEREGSLEAIQDNQPSHGIGIITALYLCKFNNLFLSLMIWQS